MKGPRSRGTRKRGLRFLSTKKTGLSLFSTAHTEKLRLPNNDCPGLAALLAEGYAPVDQRFHRWIGEKPHIVLVLFDLLEALFGKAQEILLLVGTALNLYYGCPSSIVVQNLDIIEAFANFHVGKSVWIGDKEVADQKAMIEVLARRFIAGFGRRSRLLCKVLAAHIFQKNRFVS